MRFFFSLIFALSVVCETGFADELDAASAKGLADTQEMLANPTLRNETIKKDASAIQADQNLKKLGLQKASEESAYQISSELLEKYVKESGGDRLKLEALTKELLRNPAALEKDLTPAQREKIRRMSEEIAPSQSNPH